MTKKYIVPLTLCLLILSACKAEPEQPRNAVNLQHHLQNPLFTERYGEEMLDQLTVFEINKDEIFDDEKKETFINELRSIWRPRIKEASQKQRGFPRGFWIPNEAYAEGQVLLTNDVVYFGPGTEITPSSHLRLYITSVLDPRDEVFPDSSSIDLGTLHNFYGPQAYKMNPIENLLPYRTAVLYDSALEKIYAFAQLTPVVE